MRRLLISLLLVADMARLVRAFARLQTSSAYSGRSAVIVFTDTDWRLFSTNHAAKKRVVFLGTPEVAADSLKMIHQDSLREDSPYEIVGVITQPPKRRKRKGDVTASPVGEVAETLGIPVIAPESVSINDDTMDKIILPMKARYIHNCHLLTVVLTHTPTSTTYISTISIQAKDPEFLDDFENNIKPDLCITAAYGQYLPKRFLAAPTHGTVNIHPSLLPRWRGASPVQRSLEAGDNPVGVSVLFTVSKMDAGPIISQTEQAIGDDDQATTVLPMLFDIGTKSLLAALPDVLSGKITMENAQKQDPDKIANADMIDAAEAELRVWEETALVCHNRVRGFSMWPGTFVYLQIGNEEPTKVKIVRTRVTGERTEPTDVIVKGEQKNDGLRLICHDGTVLEIMELQPVTKKVMDAKSFVNGLRGRQVRWIETPESPDPNYHIK